MVRNEMEMALEVLLNCVSADTNNKPSRIIEKKRF